LRKADPFGVAGARFASVRESSDAPTLGSAFGRTIKCK
jgi:hypothetical protein